MSYEEPLPPVLSSRFSNDTWGENELYRSRHNSTGCIYGSPLHISAKIHVNAFAYVLEMNNSTNHIEGVGVIRNYPNVDQPPWIYSNNNYNRYIYEGNHRMDRADLVRYDAALVDTIEAVCFKGKTHLKRGSGLTLVPKKLLVSTTQQVKDITHNLRTVFRKHFRGDLDNEADRTNII
jgi:hypothetical protein